MYSKANTFQEYTESFYVTSTDVLVTVCYVIIVFNVDGLFQVTDSCVEVANTSKCKIKYFQAKIMCVMQSRFNFGVNGAITPGSP